jgi:hypothetical protein
MTQTDQAHTLKANGGLTHNYSFLQNATVDNVISGAIKLTGVINLKKEVGQNAWAITINNYASASSFKPFNYDGTWLLSGAWKSIMGGGAIETNSAITSIELFAVVVEVIQAEQLKFTELNNMNRPMVRIHNLAIDEVIDREMNDDEFAQYEANKAAQAIAVAEAEAKATAKAALLAQLGITEEQAKLLLS